jgi:phage gpG-like protein
MARSKPLFDKSDLIPSKAFGSTKITASASLRGTIQFSTQKLSSIDLSAKFERAINRASQRIAVDLKRALDDAMSSPVWGGTDLVDTGALMASGRVSVSQNGITIAYDAPYAALIHYGGYIHPYGNVNLRVFLPPRPWVESLLFGGGPVQQFDFVSYYTQEILAEFNG